MSKKIENKLKEEKKIYKKAQAKYMCFEEKLQKNNKNPNVDFSPQEEFQQVLHSISQSKQEQTKKKKMNKLAKSLTNFHRYSKKTGGKSRIRNF